MERSRTPELPQSKQQDGLSSQQERRDLTTVKDGLDDKHITLDPNEAPSVAESEDTEAGRAPPAPSLGDVPDGGVDAWLQVLGSWVIMVNTWGLVNTYGVYQTYYETVLLKGQSSSSISWMGSLQAALLMMLGSVSGPLYDAGHLRLLVRLGLFLIVFGMFMTSLCSAYWQVLLAQGFCIGIGMGLTFLPSTAIISQYFRRHRALALGIASSGSPVVGMIFPVIFSHLEKSIGFGWATRVIAFILLGLNIIPVCFMHTRVPPTRPPPPPPPPPGADVPGGDTAPEKPKPRPRLDFTVLRDGPLLLIIVACFFAFLTLYVAFFYIQLYAQLHGVQPLSFAPYLVTLLNAGSVVGRILPNALADRFGSLNVLLACTCASAVLALGWLGIERLGGLVAFALLYGGFSGGVLSVLPNVLISLTPDLSRLGARMGILFLISGLSVLGGTPIAGAVLGDSDRPEWKGMIGYSAAGMMVATLLLIAARVVLYRRNGRARM